MSSPSSNIEDIIRPIKKPPKIRSDHDISLIQEATKNIPFFEKYIQEGKEDLHLKCCKHITYEKCDEGAYVFEAGEKGTKFYVILEGKVGIFIQNKSESKKVKELAVGESFGELALVNDAPRSASIKCLKICHFAVLDKKNYITLFQQILDEEIKREVTFYPNIELFSSWNFNKIKSFYNSSFRINVKKGEKIISEGDPLDAIYIIISGEFVVKKHKNNQESLRKIAVPSMRKSIASSNSQMQLFIMSKYEIFGQEFADQEEQNFYFSVSCHSFDGNLIYIKLQDYLRVIQSDQSQISYMQTYSQNRINRVEERMREVSHTLNKTEKDSPTYPSADSPKPPTSPFKSNHFYHRENSQTSDDMSNSNSKLHFLSPSSNKIQARTFNDLGNINDIQHELNSLNIPTIGGMHALAKRSSLHLQIPPLITSKQTDRSSISYAHSNSINNLDEICSPSKNPHSPLLHRAFSKKGSILESQVKKPTISSMTSLDILDPPNYSSSAIEKPKGFSLNLQAASVPKKYNKKAFSILKTLKTLEEVEIQSMLRNDTNESNDNIKIEEDDSPKKLSPLAEKNEHKLPLIKSDSISIQIEDSLTHIAPNITNVNSMPLSKGVKIPLKLSLKDSSQIESTMKISQEDTEQVEYQDLHPLVKAFHDQLKLRYYNKFKHGQIEDLKQHLNYTPIQTLQVGKKDSQSSLKNQTLLDPKKQKDKRIKDLREYQLKLQQIIKYDASIPIESISPLYKNNSNHSKSLKKELDSSSNKAFQFVINKTNNTEERLSLLSSNQTNQTEEQQQQEAHDIPKQISQIIKYPSNIKIQESSEQCKTQQSPNKIDGGYLFGKTIKHQHHLFTISKDQPSLLKEIQTQTFFQGINRIHGQDRKRISHKSMTNIFNSSLRTSEMDIFKNNKSSSLIQSNQSNSSTSVDNYQMSSNLIQDQQQMQQQNLNSLDKSQKKSKFQIFFANQNPEPKKQNKRSLSSLENLLTCTYSPQTATPIYSCGHQKTKKIIHDSIQLSQDISFEKEQISLLSLNQTQGGSLKKSGSHSKSVSMFAANQPAAFEISKYQFQKSSNAWGGFKGQSGFNCSQFNLRKDKQNYYSQLYS